MPLGRTPPASVRAGLCHEVGFRCPVDDCGNPYLTFHHFDPPWRIRKHHEPSGMIALCADHAAKADGGAYPDEHLRRLKREGRSRAVAVSGKFEYLRNDMIAILGGTAYLRTPTPLQVGGRRCIYFNRDENGYLLLNIKIPELSGGTRRVLEDNVWTVPPHAAKIVCPPQGRSLKVEFENGDMFKVEFRDFHSLDALTAAHPTFMWGHIPNLAFPVTVVSFWERAANSYIEFSPSHTRVGDGRFHGGLTVDCKIGMQLGISDLRPAEAFGLDPATAQAVRDQLAAWHRERG